MKKFGIFLTMFKILFKKIIKKRGSLSELRLNAWVGIIMAYSNGYVIMLTYC